MFASRLSSNILPLRQKIQSVLITSRGISSYVYRGKIANVSGSLKLETSTVYAINKTKWLHLLEKNRHFLRVNSLIFQRNIHSSSALFGQEHGQNQQVEKMKNMILLGVIVSLTLVVVIFRNMILDKNHDIVLIEEK